MKPSIDLRTLCQELLRVTADFESPATLAANPLSHIAALKEFAATARPLLEGALQTGLTEVPARRILMAMKNVQLFTRGMVVKSIDLPNFFALKTRLAEALEFSLIPFHREVPS